MMVESSSAVSGVNYPVRGSVQPDGLALLRYGDASLVGRFGPGGFSGRASTGDGCTWLVTLARQEPIGSAPGAALPPGADVVQGEVPEAPGLEAVPLRGVSVAR